MMITTLKLKAEKYGRKMASKFLKIKGKTFLKKIGLDASTTTVGYAFVEDKNSYNGIYTHSKRRTQYETKLNLQWKR